jgi:hypothetical protein
MMNLSDTILDSALNNSLKLDCVEMILTQNVSSDPIILKGSGSIYQDEKGSLKLKMYHVFKEISKEMLQREFSSPPPGKIIGDEDYYSLEAMDMSGNIWKAKRLLIGGDLSFPSKGRVIRASIFEIVNSSERVLIDKESLTLFVIGKFSIPWNATEKLAQGGWIGNILKFSLDDIDYEFKKFEKFLAIGINGHGTNILNHLKNSVIEVLSILLGRVVRPCCLIERSGNIIKKKIRSIDLKKTDSALPPPIENNEEPDFVEFIKCYLKRFNRQYPPLFGYWHKINSAHQGQVEISALALSVSIEGLVKEYFVDYGHAESKLLKEAEDAENVIKGLGFTTRLLNRLLESLNLLKKPSPKSALYDLSRQGWFPKSLVEVWVKLRNKSTHADKLNLDIEEEELQKYLDEVNSCLNLFYRLVFWVISYKGKFINHSLRGWPLDKFGTSQENKP